MLVSEGGLTMTFDNVRLKGCLQPSTLHISCTYCKASQYIQLRATHNDYSPSSTFLECSDCFITSWGKGILIKDHFFQFNFLITRKHWCRWPDRWPIWQTTAWKLSRSLCVWHIAVQYFFVSGTLLYNISLCLGHCCEIFLCYQVGRQTTLCLALLG